MSAIGAGGVVAGLLVGDFIGRGTVHPDPTASAQYHQLQQRFVTDEQQIGNLQSDIGAARSTAAAVQGAQQSAAQLSQQAEALASQQAALQSGQAALQSSQQVIAQNSITEGTWTVGTDIAPGTYRTSAPVPDQCYWGIYKSGTNKDDIIQNDIVTGGYATVKLSAGQDFEDHGCGTFVKQ